MMNSGWLLLVIAIVAIGGMVAMRMRIRIIGYQAEIRRLKENSRAMEGHVDASEHLDALFSAINEVVLKLDASGRVIAANRRASELFAITDAGLPLRQYFRDADWYALLQTALSILPEYSVLPEMKISGRVLSPRLTPLGNEQALLLCVDMTEIHKLEAQRRTFLSNLMHDLKTPLTSLLGYARSLESFGDDAELRKEAAQVIADEAKHVNHLLDTLLTLDQIDFSSPDGNAVCDPAAVLKRVRSVLKSELKQKSVKLDKQIDGDGIRPAMAADDLERVLTNVLENSLRHSPEHGHIRVQLTESDQQCLFIIEDQGPGIPERELSKVTERFYRLDKARGRKNGNHGLGLAIVKELVELHDGSLSLSNISPRGLHVEFTLPRSQQQPQA